MSVLVEYKLKWHAEISESVGAICCDTAKVGHRRDFLHKRDNVVGLVGLYFKR